MKPLLRHSDARAALFAGLLSLALLCGAWFFQYVLGYAPCIMCYWQRQAHIAVIAVAVAVILARAAFGEGPEGRGRGLPKWLGPLLLIALLLFSAGLGAFHVGVELGLWEGPQACAAVEVGELGAIDPNDPLSMLDKPVGPIACSDVAWSLLGISMAGWNALASLLGVLGTWKLGFGKARS
ncbi:disulfide bond formation protein B [uncultured Algimonas sp.]|uniref:disulfide bond formation protein B n=1 Tax=uncultured Algimonas sp. TaxID=1547920 RepID=UPI00262E66C5|nr:disulfide bond formation protein B [uncultured Algimonas sp.]